MRNYKKYFAVMLATALVAGNSTMAFAAPTTPSTPSDVTITTESDATGTTTGTGGLEGSVSEDVFCIVVPAIALDSSHPDYEASTIFDFTLDPETLITKTEGAKYATSTASDARVDFEENATMFFTREDGSLKSTSDSITVTNKSSVDVQIQLDAEVKNLGTIKMSDTSTFADTDTSMYLALKDGKGKVTPITTDTASSKSTATMKSVMAKAPTGAYDTVWNTTTNAYDYTLKADATGFDTYEYMLTGASNSKGDWSTVTNAAPTIEVTWTVSRISNAAPSITTTTYAMTQDTPVLVPFDLGSGNLAAKNIKSITYKNSSNADVVLSTDSYGITENGEIRFKPSYVNTMVTGTAFSRAYTITFDDAASTSVTITLTAAASSTP